jgi:isopentenyl-diphosphate delta-isomerase
MTATQERVTLLDEAGHAVGTALKRDVHHRETPLHLAFSCYVFDENGSLLITQRALHKPTWPGVWTNSLCGHPTPGEDIAEAVQRRALEELGVELHGLQLVLPAFRYEAEMPDGVRENEMCPVFTAVARDTVAPAASEVAACAWVDWPRFRDDVIVGTRDVSPWCVQQVHELSRRETPDGQFRPAEASALPPAARWTRSR